MSRSTPSPVAAHLAGLTRAPHPVLERIREDGRTSGVPTVDPLTGALLQAMTRATGAARVLEIGTGLGGSTIWMATAQPATGLLVTVERDHARATAARGYLREAGVDNRVNVMIGDARRYLHKLAGPFDLIFQDGDDGLHGTMLDPLVALLRPGGVLVIDHVLGSADVAPGDLEASRARLAADPRLSTAWLPVGDGVAMAIKTSG